MILLELVHQQVFAQAMGPHRQTPILYSLFVIIYQHAYQNLKTAMPDTSWHACVEMRLPNQWHASALQGQTPRKGCSC